MAYSPRYRRWASYRYSDCDYTKDNNVFIAPAFFGVNVHTEKLSGNSG